MTPTILQCLDHKDVFAPLWHRPDTGRAWRVFLSALFALPIADEDLPLFRQCTGRDTPPTAPSTECWLVCGRRSGKSRVLALLAVFIAVFRNFAPHLSAGERGIVQIIAPDRRQSRITLRYIHALLAQVPALAEMIEAETADEIGLNNQTAISVTTCNFKTIRGTTTIAALLDECAFWRDESSSNPDIEVLAALRPAMATIPGAILIGASSPFGKHGILYDAWARHFGRADAPALVWHAPTRVMNPTVEQRVLDEAYARDPVNAEAEYGAQWRVDVAAFLDRALIASATDTGITVRPPLPSTSYTAFADPSGGSSDRF